MHTHGEDRENPPDSPTVGISRPHPSGPHLLPNFRLVGKHPPPTTKPELGTK